MKPSTGIVQWNCEGLLPKKGELEIIIAEKDPMCICLQETKLPYNKECNLPGFKPFLRNLEVADGGIAHGGVAVYVRKGVSAMEVKLNTRLQAIAVSIKFKNRVTVCSLYLPPAPQVIRKKDLENLLAQLPKPFLLLGDFNARSKLWYDSDYCPRGKMVEKIIEEGDVFFLDGDKKTHFSRRHRTFSHVDLSICSTDIMDGYKWEVDEDFHSSDHVPIYLTSNDPRPVGGCQRWIVSKADWAKFRELTELDVDVHNDIVGVDAAVTFLDDIIIDAATQSIPRSKGTGKRKSPPWWNTACRGAIKKRQAAWKKYNKDSTEEKYLVYLRLRAEAQRVLKCSKRIGWAELIGSINSKTPSQEVQRKINILKNKHKSELVTTLKVESAKIVFVENVADVDEIIKIAGAFGCILGIKKSRLPSGEEAVSIRFESEAAAQGACNHLNGGRFDGEYVKATLEGQVGDFIIYDEPARLADCLGRRFEFVSSSYNCDVKFNQSRKQREKFLNFFTARLYGYNARITWAEMNAALGATSDTSPGPDGIHYSMLKNLHETGKRFLLEVLNMVFDSGRLPKHWKLAHVIPILKEGKSDLSPDSYRPIALTSCLCKLLEKILNVRLMRFLVMNNLIDKSQSGFQKLKSTLDNLAALETEIHDAFIKKQYLLAVFFDLEKAYDTCWRHLILEELHNFGMRGKLPLLIQDFLQERKFQVRVGHQYSQVFSQEMGVPQGSVLSVTLFLIAINTVIREVKSQVGISIYVDDMRFSIPTARLACGIRRMQRCLGQLDGWTEKTGFRFSSSKTEVMVFHRQRGLYEDPNPELYLKGKKLKVVTTKKFLGVIFDHKLTWIPHIKWLKAKAIRALSILKVIVKNNSRTDSKILLNMYKSLVRSKLDYASQVYGTASPTALKMLDTVHHQALRLCTGAFRTSPVESLNVEAGEQPLQYRRMSLQLQYYVRSRQLPVDKTIVQLGDDTSDYLYRRVRNKPKSLRYKVRQDAQMLDLVFPPIPIFSESILGPWELPLLDVCMELSACSKSDTLPEEFVQRFAEHRHVVDLDLFTDGSKFVDGVGAGFGITTNVPGNGFSGRRLHLMSSVFTAELYAIKLALITLRVQENRACALYSDSRSALQAIQNSRSTNKLILEIQELVAGLLRQQVTVTFCWIPSHVGIEGNEAADKAAKEAATRGQVHRQEVPVPDILAHIKSRVKEKWAEAWHQIEDNKKLRGIQPTISVKDWSLDRKDAIKLTRLRIGHTRLTHGFLLVGEELPWCEVCDTALSVEHILLQCGNHGMERRQCFDFQEMPSMKVLLSDGVYIKKVLEFLHRIELYKEI